MINVTKTQKDVFLAFAKKYDPDVSAVVSRGGPESLEIVSEAEKEEVELFASKIGSLVLNDYPDYDGKGQDINDDATMVSFIISALVHDYVKRKKDTRDRVR